MRVTLIHETHMDNLLADPDIRDLTVLVHENQVARRIIGDLLRVFRKKLNPESLERYVRHWSTAHPASPEEITWLVQELAPRIYELYDRHDQGRLRGAVIERLVYLQIEPRYANNRLGDNVRVVLENGIDFSSSTSVDVVGWDENYGECHDCRARSAKINIEFIRELEENLPDAHFKVGVVSVDSRSRMVGELAAAGYKPGPQTSLIPVDQLWALAPLQAA